MNVKTGGSGEILPMAKVLNRCYGVPALLLLKYGREDGKTTDCRDFRLLKIPWAHHGRKWLHSLCNEIPIDCEKAGARRCTCSGSPVKSCPVRRCDRGFLWKSFRCRILIRWFNHPMYTESPYRLSIVQILFKNCIQNRENSTALFSLKSLSIHM